MVLCGKINKELVNLIEQKGGKAMGLSGIDGCMIHAVMKDEKLGFVGNITGINTEPIDDVVGKGYIPVIAGIGSGEDGSVYNVNADTAAAFIAGALGAERLISMTDIAGVMRDKNDPESVIPCMDIEEAHALFEDGTIAGGMIPKVQCCIDAIQKGVERVTILDGRVPHALLLETLTDEGAGTMVVKERKKDE